MTVTTLLNAERTGVALTGLRFSVIENPGLRSCLADPGLRYTALTGRAGSSGPTTKAVGDAEIRRKRANSAQMNSLGRQYAAPRSPFFFAIAGRRSRLYFFQPGTR